MAKNLFYRFGKEIYRELSNGNFRALNNFRYYNNWKGSLKPGHNSISDEQPWIAFPAIDFLKEHVHEDSLVFEYGAGGSTLFFINRAKEVFTVEHHPDWFSKVLEKINSKGKTNPNVYLILPEKHDTIPDLDPSDPMDYYTSDEAFLDCTFRSYASYIDHYPDNYFDVVMVDGRSRPSCIWHSIPKVKAGGFLVLDNSNRKHYFAIQENQVSEHFKLLHDFTAPSPYVGYFTHTRIWCKR